MEQMREPLAPRYCALIPCYQVQSQSTPFPCLPTLMTQKRNMHLSQQMAEPEYAKPCNKQLKSACQYPKKMFFLGDSVQLCQISQTINDEALARKNRVSLFLPATMLVLHIIDAKFNHSRHHFFDCLQKKNSFKLYNNQKVI